MLVYLFVLNINKKIYQHKVDDGAVLVYLFCCKYHQKKYTNTGGAAASPPPPLGGYMFFIDIYNRKDIPTVRNFLEACNIICTL